MKYFFSYDVLTLIIPPNRPELKLVNKEWFRICTYRNLENIEHIVHQIINGNSKNLRFQSCYHDIYIQTIRRRSPDIIYIIKNTCLNLRNKVQWYERKKYAQLLNDICLYMNSTFIKKKNMKTVYFIALNALASKKHISKVKSPVLNHTRST